MTTHGCQWMLVRIDTYVCKVSMVLCPACFAWPVSTTYLISALTSALSIHARPLLLALYLTKPDHVSLCNLCLQALGSPKPCKCAPPRNPPPDATCDSQGTLLFQILLLFWTYQSAFLPFLSFIPLSPWLSCTCCLTSYHHSFRFLLLLANIAIIILAAWVLSLAGLTLCCSQLFPPLVAPLYIAYSSFTGCTYP